MRELCSRIVESLDSYWSYIGWALFLCWFLIPYMPAPTVVWLVLGVLLLVWWLMDLIEQLVPAWMIALGVVMLTIGFLPSGRLLIVACWVIYWYKVRE